MTTANDVIELLRERYPRGGVRLGQDFQIELLDGSEAYAQRCYVGVQDAGGLRELAAGASWDEVLAALRKTR